MLAAADMPPRLHARAGAAPRTHVQTGAEAHRREDAEQQPVRGLRQAARYPRAGGAGQARRGGGDTG